MTYISRCEHGTPMGLCLKCFPDVSEQPDWSKYRHTHPVKEPLDWNEEEFNHIAYSYRSWLASDPKGVSDRYEELINYVQSITQPANLTDEEIMFISETFEDRVVNTKQQWSACILDFARAILRKASDK